MRQKPVWGASSLGSQARHMALGDHLHRRLQPFRCLHDCSDYYRLERQLPRGTHRRWKTVPLHSALRSIGVHMKRPPSVITLALLCLCLAVNAGCGGGGGDGSSSDAKLAMRFSITAPGIATAGDTVNFTVTALDSSNNTAVTYSGMVHFSSSDGHAQLPADSTMTNGTGTFAAILETSGSQTITATDTTTASLRGTSNSIEVSTSGLHFSLTVPAAAAAGSAFNFSVSALDAAGKTVIGYSGTVAFASSDTNGMLPGNSTLTNGTGTFSATLESVGPQTIKATDTVTSTITGSSNAIQVSTRPGTFTPTGSMGTARMVHTATLLQDGRVLVTGGIHLTSSDNSALGDAELYDPASGTFAPAAGSMPVPRAGHTATLLNTGRVLVCGGDGSAGPSPCDLFDPSTGTFQPTGKMAIDRVDSRAVLLTSGKVLVLGGVPVTGGMPVGTAEIYDPVSGTFSRTGSMSTGRTLHTATLLNDGRVLVAGGQDPNSRTIATAEIFDPATGKFTPTANMGTPRYFHEATLLGSGKVVVLGGWDAVSNELATAELFDPVSGTFTPTGTMQSSRVCPMIILLKNGTVLVAGGGEAVTNSIASAEIYYPMTGIFTPTGSMGTARAFAAAAILEDGRMLVSGGTGISDGWQVSFTSAELYQ
jgi:hypothetical protein